MKLTILDRILIMQILPAESDFVTLKLVKELKDNLSFNDKEIKKYNIKTINNEQGRGQITWDSKALNKTEDIKIVRAEREIIIEQLEKLDKEKKANIHHVELYDKIKKFHDEIEKEG